MSKFKWGYVEEIERLRKALQDIADIKDNYEGGDWDEIEEARKIANDALGVRTTPSNPHD